MVSVAPFSIDTWPRTMYFLPAGRNIEPVMLAGSWQSLPLAVVPAGQAASAAVSVHSALRAKPSTCWLGPTSSVTSGSVLPTLMSSAMVALLQELKVTVAVPTFCVVGAVNGVPKLPPLLRATVMLALLLTPAAKLSPKVSQIGLPWPS